MIRRAAAAAALAVVASPLAGCGGGTKTGTTPTRTVTVSQTATSTSASGSQTPSSGTTSRPPATADAEQYARRTYVVQPQFGKRVFKISGPAATVTAGDGSLITAFSAVIANSGDGTGQAVLLFRGTKFLGWATDRLAVRLSASGSGSQIAVRYGAFQGNDPLCCPSSTRTVRYSWNGSRVVADGDPPLVYGKPGDRLHLAPPG